MASAAARHILVETEAACADLKKQIDGGTDFAELAKEHSTCPSGAKGGALGTFGPGQMVKEFDEVVFSAPVGEVQGPVKTQFGYHLLEVTHRAD
jgi:peptidyl-prolyl cis-trans isomerase C